MAEIDLTPFGFTPTESMVYAALLGRGPSGGYPIANDIGVARANVYQALRSLVQKGAAEQVSKEPMVFRAVRTEVLFALIVDQESRMLDVLEDQLEAGPVDAESGSTRIGSARALVKLVTSSAARGQANVGMLGPAGLIRQLVPVWRKRDADGESTRLMQLDDGDSGFQTERVDPDRVESIFGSRDVCLFYSVASAFSGIARAELIDGTWTTDPLQTAVIRAALERAAI